ncbi:acyl carrier protein [uncultured Fluviicola sp.]|uniref:acyl carrier protein n=1 Tax=uncultured Fluviicola sp. TaxID=463303 RepID=UPI0025EB7D80|nr:acyl carrier protein [uncultured Fluviicola sp.]
MEEFIIDKIEEIAFSRVKPSDSLWQEKVLDSITIVELVVELENEFGIKIPFNEIVEDNFETVERIVTYLNSKK